MKKRNVRRVMVRTLLGVVFVFGLFAIMICSHEAYHYFTVEGKATGICFGNCASNSAGMMISGVYFDEINTDKINIMKNESEAWHFSLFFTGLMGALSCYGLKKYSL